jgi:hypothetical protein
LSCWRSSRSARRAQLRELLLRGVELLLQGLGLLARGLLGRVAGELRLLQPGAAPPRSPASAVPAARARGCARLSAAARSCSRSCASWLALAASMFSSAWRAKPCSSENSCSHLGQVTRASGFRTSVSESLMRAA